jgi:hypothetical protein
MKRLRIEVFGEANEESVLRLELQQHGDIVRLVAVDHVGLNAKYLLTIMRGSDGKAEFSRVGGISDDFPLNLDSEGRIDIK